MGHSMQISIARGSMGSQLTVWLIIAHERRDSVRVS